jgi:hypothetical protein
MFFTTAVKQNKEYYDVTKAKMKEMYDFESRHKHELREEYVFAKLLTFPD